MVKKDAISDKETPAVKSVKKHFSFVKLFLFLILAGGIYGLAAYPQVRQSSLNYVLSWFNTEDDYQNQLNLMKSQILALQQSLQQMESQKPEIDFSYVDEKISDIEKFNRNVIDSKANVATVLGVITRMDKAEQRLDTLSKVSDESALILTAAMLVKDSAERGNHFEYEAEVLQELAKGAPQFAEAVQVVASYAPKGIVSQDVLEFEFDDIYQSLIKEQKATFEKNWKDRINSKLNELVQIKRVNEKALKFVVDEKLEDVKTAVDEGKLALAVQKLEMLDNPLFKENKALQNWIEKAKANVAFYRAINKISASSLAIMKVKFLKNQN